MKRSRFTEEQIIGMIKEQEIRNAKLVRDLEDAEQPSALLHPNIQMMNESGRGPSRLRSESPVR